MPSDQFLTSAADAVVALGNLISLHNDPTNSPPVAADANEISGSPYARLNTAWGSAVVGTGGEAGKGVATGSTIEFNVAAGGAANCYGVRATDGTFLWGAPLTPGVQFNGSGNGKVQVTPVYKYSQP